MLTIEQISDRLCKQDNRMTENPMFCVQILRRDVGYDTANISNSCWHNSETGETIYDDDKDQPEALNEDDWERSGYVDRWETVMVAFTQKGCEEYLALNGHNDRIRAFRGEVQIYVDTFNRCPEMIFLRNFLKQQAGPLRKFTVEYGGGIGPDVWEREMTVDAVSIPDAYQIACSKVVEFNGHVFSVSEQ